METHTTEFAVATHPMRLHELQLDSLGGAGVVMPAAMALALSASFGSPQRWRDEFVAMGRVLGGGSGWVLLVFRPHEATLVNQCVADPLEAVAAGVPMLALDAAGFQADSSIDDIRWERVYARYQQAVEQASEAFGADEVDGAVLLDVRRSAVFEQSAAMIPGAEWRDPAQVGRWAAQLPAGREVVVYCVYGHEVGRVTAMRLRAAGIAARYLRGGIDAWNTSGKPVQPKGGAS